MKLSQNLSCLLNHKKFTPKKFIVCQLEDHNWKGLTRAPPNTVAQELRNWWRSFSSLISGLIIALWSKTRFKQEKWKLRTVSTGPFVGSERRESRRGLANAAAPTPGAVAPKLPTATEELAWSAEEGRSHGFTSAFTWAGRGYPPVVHRIPLWPRPLWRPRRNRPTTERCPSLASSTYPSSKGNAPTFLSGLSNSGGSTIRWYFSISMSVYDEYHPKEMSYP